MWSIFAFALVVLCFLGASCAEPSSLHAREQCGAGYKVCNPTGGKVGTTPQVGEALSSLYVDMLSAISGASKSKRDVQEVANRLEVRAASSLVCCVESMQCLVVQQVDVPFCYDKFTTNFFLPDGSYGSIVLGDYTAPDGARANLLTGTYVLANGTSGNIYAENMDDKPDTATLPMPTPWTSEGVGGPIAASTLGGFQTYPSSEATATTNSAEATTRSLDASMTATPTGETSGDSTNGAKSALGGASRGSILVAVAGLFLVNAFTF